MPMLASSDPGSAFTPVAATVASSRVSRATTSGSCGFSTNSTSRVAPALVPVPILQALLGGEDVDEPVGENVEAVGLGDVTLQAGRVELGQHEDAVDAGVQAVGD